MQQHFHLAADRPVAHQILAQQAQHREFIVVRPDTRMDAPADMVEVVLFEARQPAAFGVEVARLHHSLVDQLLDMADAVLGRHIELVRLRHGDLRRCRVDHVAGFGQLPQIGPVVQQLGRRDLILVQEQPEKPAHDHAAFQGVEVGRLLAHHRPLDPAFDDHGRLFDRRPDLVQDLGPCGEAGQHGAVTHHPDLLVPRLGQEPAADGDRVLLFRDDAMDQPATFMTDQGFIAELTILDHEP